MAQEQMQTFTGMVTRVEVRPKPEYARGADIPAIVSAEIIDSKGVRCYVDTTCGKFTPRWRQGPMFAQGPARPGQVRPWAIDGEDGQPALLVHRGDAVTVAGQIDSEPRTSSRNNKYVKARRATVVAWMRTAQAPLPGDPADETPPAVPEAPRATIREVTPARQIAAMNASERPDPGDEDPTCKHGNVIYRAGDCEQCEAEEAANTRTFKMRDQFGNDLGTTTVSIPARAVSPDTKPLGSSLRRTPRTRKPAAAPTTARDISEMSNWLNKLSGK
jgi:hypothetical protein